MVTGVLMLSQIIRVTMLMLGIHGDRWYLWVPKVYMYGEEVMILGIHGYMLYPRTH